MHCINVSPLFFLELILKFSVTNSSLRNQSKQFQCCCQDLSLLLTPKRDTRRKSIKTSWFFRQGLCELSENCSLPVSISNSFSYPYQREHLCFRANTFLSVLLSHWRISYCFMQVNREIWISNTLAKLVSASLLSSGRGSPCYIHFMASSKLSTLCDE